MEPQPIGTKFYNAELSDFASRVLISPAANVNGLILRTASLAVGTAILRLTTGTKAPSGYEDKTVPTILVCNGAGISSGSNYGDYATLPFPLVIPAGQGLFAYVNQSGSGKVAITYDLVPAE